MKFYTFVFFLLMASSVFAFTITVPDQTTFVPVGGSTEVEVNVSSTFGETVSLTILENTPWITQSESLIHLNPGEQISTRLFVAPPIGTMVGVYKITLLAESGSGQQRKSIYINVNKADLVSIDKVIVNGSLKPTGQVNILESLKNFRDKTVQDIRVVTTVSSPSSDVVQFEQVIDSLDSGDSKNISYTFTIPKYSESGLYTVNVTATAIGTFDFKIRTFTVSSAATFSTDYSKLPSVFGFRKVVTVTNIGNTPGDATITDKISGLDASFFSGSLPASTANGDYSWIIRNVAPGESRSIAYSVDYSPLVLLLVVLGVGTWFYAFKIRTIRIKKYIMERKFIEEGEEFTVGIEIINTSGTKSDSVTVKDFVPSVFDIREMDGPKPSRRKVATGTELIWNLKDLHNNEERLFSYKMIPMFGIRGQIRLPQASVSFKRGKQEVENKSYFATIGIEMENYKDKGKKRSPSA